MKSHYYLAQALLPQRHVGEALEEAKTAYDICLKTQDSSSEVISSFILRAKQAKWQAKETARLREMNDTLALVEDLLESQLQRDLEDVRIRFERSEIGETGRKEEVEELQGEAEVRRSNIRKGFEDSQKPDTLERVRFAVRPMYKADTHRLFPTILWTQSPLKSCTILLLHLQASHTREHLC
jgi:STIP1 homology and U-box containing protein 1